MFALLAAVAFGVASFRWFFETPTASSQAGWLLLGLTLLALHWAFGWALPRFPAPQKQPQP